MKNTGTISKNWGKLKSWFKKTFSKTSLEEKKTKEANAVQKEKRHGAFKPKFRPQFFYSGNPIWFGTNKDRKKKTNKIHRSRITKRKHRKTKAA